MRVIPLQSIKMCKWVALRLKGSSLKTVHVKVEGKQATSCQSLFLQEQYSDLYYLKISRWPVQALLGAQSDLGTHSRLKTPR